MRFYIIILFGLVSQLTSQIDTTHYQWPTPSFTTSKGLTATFGEFRNTGNSDHFHNAVDIGEPDGNPVYPSIDGVVHYLSINGYDSYINVKSVIDGRKKHLTYYHVVPSPSLNIGQQVKAGQTIIGTIYVGAAHVHLIERELLDLSSSNIGNEINPVRPEGGLNPYFDSYAPSINGSTLRFFKDNTSIQIPSDQLTGNVDIRIEVREKNGPAYSHGNNGTYILGYRILSGDGSSVVFEPENDGIKYRFYFIPSDSDVHKVFVKGVATLSDPVYWLTNGNGEEQINSTFSVSNNYLNTDLLAKGTYQLEIFSEDTRANKSSKRFPFSVEKLPPELKTVLVKNDSIHISWSKYNLPTLVGYRIYYSGIDSEIWNLVADEKTLTNETTKIVFEKSDKFLVPTSLKNLKFFLTAVDSSNNESISSDIYSTAFFSSDLSDIIIVDGFDRYGGTGSWKEPNHNFNIAYTQTIINSTSLSNVSSCSNEAVMDEDVFLTDYDMVIWFTGDESIADNTLINSEQYTLAQFLENGGKLFISGEDIGQDLDTKHTYSEFSDTLFYHQYLKAKLIHDGIDLLFEVNGETGTIFDGLNVQFGETYSVDAPDDIEPINGSHPIFNYTYERDTTFRKGGIAYTGTFGNSTENGGLVYLSFPFETIKDSETKVTLYDRIREYLGFSLVKVNEQNPVAISAFKLIQNYPNPFNPLTKIEYSVPAKSNTKSFIVTLTVYDILGRKIKTLVNKIHESGNYQIEFDGSNFPSGVYYYRLKSSGYFETKKMVLLK